MLEIDFLFKINFNLSVETNLYNTYNRRLLPHIQPRGKEDGGVGNSGSKIEPGEPQNEQIEQDEAAPSATHSPPPHENKEIDSAQKPQVTTQPTSRGEAGSSGAINFELISCSPSPQTEGYLRQVWV